MPIPLRVKLGEMLRQRLLPKALAALENAERAVAASPAAASDLDATPPSGVLILFHGMGGGADKQALAEATELARQGSAVSLLTFQVMRRRFVFYPQGLDGEKEYFYMPFGLRKLWARLDAARFAEARVHHLRYWPAYVAAALPPYFAARRIAVTVHLHDFYYVCPRLHLVTGDYKFCGLPTDAAICDACVGQAGHFVNMPSHVAAWRQDHLRLLRQARQLVAPSHDTAHAYRRVFPELVITTQPHSAVQAPAAPPMPAARHETVNIAIVGHLLRHKGADLALAVADVITAQKLPLTLTVIGDSIYAPELAAKGVRVTGAYKSEDLPRLLAERRIDFVWLASIWPETYCFVLDEVKKAGYPVMVFDLGAPAERTRLRGDARDIILPLALADDATQLCARFASLLPAQETAAS